MDTLAVTLILLPSFTELPALDDEFSNMRVFSIQLLFVLLVFHEKLISTTELVTGKEQKRIPTTMKTLLNNLSEGR